LYEASEINNGIGVVIGFKGLNEHDRIPGMKSLRLNHSSSSMQQLVTDDVRDISDGTDLRLGLPKKHPSSLSRHLMFLNSMGIVEFLEQLTITIDS
jgi:hypothetical protein